MIAGTDLTRRLSEPYALAEESIQNFRQEGFVKLSHVFDAEILDYYGEAITEITLANNKHAGVPMEDRATYAKAFIQVGNLWCRSETVKTFSFSERLARIASELLGVSGVRMWHDQSLYKEQSGGFTPWHADQQYWPMASEKCVTAWIPLQAVPSDMGPLAFGEKSHLVDFGRNLSISDDSEDMISQFVAESHLLESCEPFALGDVSFHYGWTLHRAGPNTSHQPRKVHTIIYMDHEMRLAEPTNDNQRLDWEAWTPSTAVGEIMDDELNPVLYRQV